MLAFEPTILAPYFVFHSSLKIVFCFSSFRRLTLCVKRMMERFGISFFHLNWWRSPLKSCWLIVFFYSLLCFISGKLFHLHFCFCSLFLIVSVFQPRSNVLQIVLASAKNKNKLFLFKYLLKSWQFLDGSGWN